MSEFLAFVDDTRFDAHRAPGPHPERPERLGAARRGIGKLDRQRLRRVEPRPADEQELQRIHGATYLQQLRTRLDGSWGHLDADTYFAPESAEAAWLAAGGTIELAEALRRGDTHRGWALVRPPGHHARPSAAMGFCLLNNIALAAAHLRAQGLQRVAIVDWDVHHGNGTQESFAADPEVLFVSLHQWPFYPGTGAAEEIGQGDGRGRSVNVALPAGSGPAIYAESFRRLVLPVMAEFDPDVVLVSAGFDAHADDPLASMQLDAESYAAMATSLVRHVERAGHGRIGFVLEGGYDLGAIESSVEAVSRAALGEPTELPEASPEPAERAALERTLHALAPHWDCLHR